MGEACAEIGRDPGELVYSNALVLCCGATEREVRRRADAIGHDPRIGRRFLQAGLGFGGGCLPKDLRGFMARADELGVDQALAFLREVDHINLRRRRRAIEQTREILGGRVQDRVIAVLGASFKPDSDDIRDSPALDVAKALSAEGAHVRVTDPQALANVRRTAPSLHCVDDPLAACAGVDVVLHLTEWREFGELDPSELGSLVSHRRLLDCRNTLDVPRWQRAGWTVWALGRPNL